MKIALIGYGKMGHMIEQIAISRGSSIFLVKVSVKFEINLLFSFALSTKELKDFSKFVNPLGFLTLT